LNNQAPLHGGAFLIDPDPHFDPQIMTLFAQYARYAKHRKGNKKPVTLESYGVFRSAPWGIRTLGLLIRRVFVQKAEHADITS
jgi:hypothetical protein